MIDSTTGSFRNEEERIRRGTKRKSGERPRLRMKLFSEVESKNERKGTNNDELKYKCYATLCKHNHHRSLPIPVIAVQKRILVLRRRWALQQSREM